MLVFMRRGQMSDFLAMSLIVACMNIRVPDAFVRTDLINSQLFIRLERPRRAVEISFYKFDRLAYLVKLITPMSIVGALRNSRGKDGSGHYQEV